MERLGVVTIYRLDRQSTCDNYDDGSSDDDSDAADLADEGSEEEYSDEEEYCMLVRGVEGKRGGCDEEKCYNLDNCAICFC